MSIKQAKPLPSYLTQNNAVVIVSSMKDFMLLAKIGEGAYSDVFKVKRISDSKVYALKKVKMGGLSIKEKENALNEVRILASINHETIIGYKEAFIEEET